MRFAFLFGVFLVLTLAPTIVDTSSLRSLLSQNMTVAIVTYMIHVRQRQVDAGCVLEGGEYSNFTLPPPPPQPTRMFRSVSASSELTDSQVGRNSLLTLNTKQLNLHNNAQSQASYSTASPSRTKGDNQSESSQKTSFDLLHLHTTLKWMDEKLNEYRECDDDDDSDSNSDNKILPPRSPPSDALILNSFLSLLFRDPSYSFLVQTVETVGCELQSEVSERAKRRRNGVDFFEFF